MEAVYWVVVIGWKFLLGCGYLLFYFTVLVGVAFVAFYKAVVGLCKLLAAGGGALLHTADQKALQEAPRDSKSIKAQPGPRDYNLPED